MDLPDATACLTQLIPETTRCKVIPKSAFDLSWFESVDFSEGKGIFFFAGGLLNYFKEEEVATLVRAMASRFSGGELIFDVPSKLENKYNDRRMKKAGVKGITFSFGLDDAVEQIAKWDPSLQVVDRFPLFSRLPHNPKWKRKTCILMRVCDWCKIVKVIQMKFLVRH